MESWSARQIILKEGGESVKIFYNKKFTNTIKTYVFFF